MQRSLSCAKEIILSTLVVVMQNKPPAFGLRVFPQRPPTCSQAAGSVQARVFVSWHSRPSVHAVINHWITLLCLLHFCSSEASSFLCTQKATFFSPQVSERWSEKREGWGAEGGRVAKGKRRVHKEVASCLTWKQKRGHSEQNEGSDWSAITLPDDQPAFDVDWLPGVRRGRKSYSVSDPCRPRGERRVTWALWMRPASITHAIHPRQASDNRCRFLSAPSYPATLDLITGEARWIRWANRDTNVSNSTCGDSGTLEQSDIHEDRLNRLHGAAALETNLIDPPEPSPIMQ